MPAKKPYHKENLRRDLLEAGRAYIEANGHLGLSIRTLAQQVGVSPGAPYHHFPDRRSFLLALAIDGFKEMLAVSQSIADSTTKPAERLRELGLAFIRFAETYPHLIDLMYESELTSPTLDEELLEFQRVGHDALRRQIAAVVPDLSDQEIDLRTLAYWSAIYGFASMRRKGIIHTSPGAVATVDIAEAIVDRAALSALTS
ncbi:MAG: TetR/AcrR family transcriptional regulator [Betaproteobacteria bacterium]|nr:TetR/AcrR family transcriptional regulator [Betaproteobacteria bacterium]